MLLKALIPRMEISDFAGEIRLFTRKCPNPFNPSTIIKFSIPEKSNIKLTTYNLLGENVEELINGEREGR